MPKQIDTNDMRIQFLKTGHLIMPMAGKTLAEVLAEVELQYLGHVMFTARGNKNRAAQLSGVSPAAFCDMAGQYTLKQIYRHA